MAHSVPMDASARFTELFEQRIWRISAAAQQRVDQFPHKVRLSARWQQQIESYYPKLLDDVASTGEPINAVLESGLSRASVRLGRYCVRHFETLALIDALRWLKRLDSTDESAASEILEVLARMEISLERLRQAEATGFPVGTRRRSRAVRLKLHPPGWQDVLIEAAPRKLKVALLILQLTGCRPCEIERGICFRIGAADSDVRLTLEIAGAKCDDDRGQPLRTFQFLASDVRPRLAELITALRSPTMHRQQETGRFRAAGISLRTFWLARKVWPDHDGCPTAYSFRYQFRQDMGHSGATRSEIARAMGHQSTASSLSYGRQAPRERSRELTMEISATFEPRIDRSERQYPNQQAGTTRAVARDLAHEPYLDQCL